MFNSSIPGLSTSSFSWDLELWIEQHFLLSVYSKNAVHCLIEMSCYESFEVSTVLSFLIKDLCFMGFQLALPSQIRQEIIDVECMYNLDVQNVFVSEWICLYSINFGSTVHYILVLLGTPFMVRLHEQLKFFVNCKISTDPAWQGLRIYLSGHEVCDLRLLFVQLQFRLNLLERSTFKVIP